MDKKYQLIFHGQFTEFNMGEFSSKKEAKEQKKILSAIWRGKFSVRKIS